ncbi:hypothetical protein ScPMuIL_014943 [Solemya velum]
MADSVMATREHLSVTVDSGMPEPSVTPQTGFGSMAIPGVVTCQRGVVCSIPLTINKDPGDTDGPDVDLGYFGPGMVFEGIDTDVSSTNRNVLATVKVTGTDVGTHDMCVQTSKSSGGNISEICFQVEVTVPPSSGLGSNHATPHFLPPTLNNGSTITCQLGRVCHVILHTAQGPNGDCPTVQQVSGVTDQLHVFRNSDATCTTEVSYIPPPHQKDTSQIICLQAFLQRTNVEKRCLVINVTTGIPALGPCHNFDCLNGGRCIGPPGGTSSCICPLSQNGDSCQGGPVPSRVIPTLPGKGFNKDLSVPVTVSCYKDQRCTIPFLVDGDKQNRPLVQLGSTDHTLNPSEPVVRDELPTTNDTVSASVDITPSQTGTHIMCVQTVDRITRVNADERCFNVSVSDGTGANTGKVDKSEAHFVSPSLPANSTVRCSPGSVCHILTAITRGTGDNSTTCPGVSQTPYKDPKFLTFQPQKTATDKCVVDVAIIPFIGRKQLCLRAGKSGEKRCLTVDGLDTQIVPASSPCQKLHCKNGGFCDSQIGAGVCHCPVGYSGANCNTTGNPTSLTNPGHGKSGFGSTAVPVLVSCVLGEPCNIPLTVNGDIGDTHSPSVGIGYVDPGLTWPDLSVTKDTGNGTDSFLTTVKVTGKDLGRHNMCVQTYKRQSIDEICFKVDIEAPSGNTPLTPMTAHFLDPTLKNGSVVMCRTSAPCHVLLQTAKVNGTCPRIHQTGHQPIDALHIFPASHVTCMSEVSYLPRPQSEGTRQSLCLQASISGLPGEERCISVHVSPTITGKGPCQNYDCEHGGHCTAHPGTAATCVCPVSFSGDKCQDAILNPSRTDATSLSSVVPSVVVCYKGKTCGLPLTVFGNPTSSPQIIQNVAPPGVSVVTSHLSQDLSKPSQYDAVLELTGHTTDGKVCLEILSGKNRGKTCFKIEVTEASNSPPIDPRLPSFSRHMLNNGSKLECQLGETCYLPVPTNQHGSVCPEVRQTDTDTKNLHVFPATDSSCRSVISVHPDTSQAGNHVACFQVGNGGEQRCYQFHFYSGNQSCSNKIDASTMREAARLGRVSCSCKKGNRTVQVVRRHHVVGTDRLLKAAGIGAGSMSAAILIAAVIYFIISHVISKSKEALPKNGSSQPSSTSRVQPFQR